ncbi:MAG: DNA polymerase IV [Armatimonadetes bacterium]|nr:DNA polymerase IV [Armatimonadota bacterium]
MTILHVDMDAFYASVEQRDNPLLRGKPVIVGGVKGRGVVSAASYEARKFGVHSAMPTTQAKRLCPQGVFLSVRMQHYAQISRQLREIFLSFTPLVEPLSLDEAFLDVRGCEGLFGPAPEIGRQIKACVKDETGLIASVGVAPNKFLAKLASDYGKPDGFVVLPPEKVTEFLSPLPVSRIWGVGAKGEQRLHALGIRTIGQLAALSPKSLTDRLGEMGHSIWRLANGLDDRKVVPDRDAKSISTETTFTHDIGDPDVLRGCLLNLVDELASRMRHEGLRGRTIELKVRSSSFETRTASRSLPEATNTTEVIWNAALSLLNKALTPDILPVRLLGIGAIRLTRDEAVQGLLFGEVARVRDKALDSTIDAIRGAFGNGAIQRGSRLDHIETRQQETREGV